MDAFKQLEPNVDGGKGNTKAAAKGKMVMFFFFAFSSGFVFFFPRLVALFPVWSTFSTEPIDFKPFKTI